MAIQNKIVSFKIGEGTHSEDLEVRAEVKTDGNVVELILSFSDIDSDYEVSLDMTNPTNQDGCKEFADLIRESVSRGMLAQGRKDERRAGWKHVNGGEILKA